MSMSSTTGKEPLFWGLSLPITLILILTHFNNFEN
jgi:hypothetical protein